MNGNLHSGFSFEPESSAKYTNPLQPFRIKTVVQVKETTTAERLQYIRVANYNVFKLNADDVMVDLLTDSGTGAMSANQWAAFAKGDQSYAGSSSWKKFESTVRGITGMEHIFPVHQGRAAERILFTAALKDGDIVPSNSHFDTTRANIEAIHAAALDFLIPEGKIISLEFPFKGNMDTAKLRKFLAEHPRNVPMVYMTVTNNVNGGQPVSMSNMKEVRKICDEFNVPFFIDACRYAENAWFIKNREEGYEGQIIREIVQEIFSLADGTHLSAKKDGLSNTGGFLALKSNMSELAAKCGANLIMTEGFLTYGGLPGSAMEVMSVGLEEGLDEAYLTDRIGQVRYLGEKLKEAGIPIVWPSGGHAVYIDAKAVLPHIKPLEYPAWALSLVLYVEGGIRSVEIGSVMFGRQSDGTEKEVEMELVRLAIPRRTYTKSHIDYTIEVVVRTVRKKDQIHGVRIVRQPTALRHFLSDFETVARADEYCMYSSSQRKEM